MSRRKLQLGQKISDARPELPGAGGILTTFWRPFERIQMDSVMSRNIHNGSVLELTKVGRPKNDETDYWPGIVQIVHFVP